MYKPNKVIIPYLFSFHIKNLYYKTGFTLSNFTGTIFDWYHPSICPSVMNVLCAKTLIPTEVIKGLFESLFHLVVDKLTMVRY